jgi:hypothetical protein
VNTVRISATSPIAYNTLMISAIKKACFQNLIKNHQKTFVYEDLNDLFNQELCVAHFLNKYGCHQFLLCVVTTAQQFKKDVGQHCPCISMLKGGAKMEWVFIQMRRLS